jgi:translation initiation factor 6
MSHVARMSIQGNPNVGLFAYATDKFVLVGKSATFEDIKTIEETLKVPVHTISVAGTGLTGIFLTGNTDYLLAPSICFDYEIKALEEICAKYNTTLIVVDTRFTALANNMSFKDTIMLASKDVEDKVLKLLKEKMKLSQIERLSVADTDVIGSTIVFTNKGGLVHPDISNQTIERLESILGIKFTLGTVNYGSPYVKSGVVVNSNGFLIGKTSSGPEVTNTDEALGFVTNE